MQYMNEQHRHRNEEEDNQRFQPHPNRSYRPNETREFFDVDLTTILEACKSIIQVETLLHTKLTVLTTATLLSEIIKNVVPPDAEVKYNFTYSLKDFEKLAQALEIENPSAADLLELLNVFQNLMEQEFRVRNGRGFELRRKHF